MEDRSRITIAVSHHCIADLRSPARALTMARAEGLDMVEFFGSDFTMDQLRAIRRVSGEEGLAVSWHPWLNIAGLRWAREICGCLEEIIKDAAVMGAGNIVIHMGEAPPDERQTYLADVVDGFLLAQPAARKAGVKFCVENVPSYIPGILGDEFADFEFLFSQTDPDVVGFTFDTGHALITGGCTEWLEAFKHRLAQAHLHGNDGISDDHLPYPDGILDWRAVLCAMMAAGFTGPYNIEFAYGEGGRELRDLLRAMAGEEIPP